MKLAAVTILAMAAFASAQDCGTDMDMGNEENRCDGPDESQKRECCEGYKCVSKNEFYAQCLAEDAEIPDGWAGTEPGTAADEEEDVEEEEEEEEDVAAEEEEEEDAAAEEEEEEDVAAEEEPDAAAPATATAGAGTYTSYPGKDYIPNPDSPTLVAIEDIDGASFTVEDEQECQELCDTEEGCNAASFYLDPSVLKGAEDLNCWLKTIGEPCEVPSDALTDDNAILILKTDTCDGATGDLDAAAPEAAAPGAAGEDGTDDEAGTETSSRSTGDTDTSSEAATTDADGAVEEDSGSSVSVRASVAALAVAAGAVILL